MTSSKVREVELSEVEKMRGHCPQCGANKWADVRGQVNKHETDDGDQVWVSTDHRILQCRGCETIYHQIDRVFSEDMVFDVNPHTGEETYDYTHDISHWPAPVKRNRPNWLDRIPSIDTDLYRLLNDVYSAIDVDLVVLGAIGVRTSFDRGAELLGVDPAITFGEKLNELESNGYIGSTERDTLAVMTDAGSASAHRGWKPTAEQFETMLQVIESFIHRNFILRTDVSQLKNAVPAKPMRRPKGT